MAENANMAEFLTVLASFPREISVAIVYQSCKCVRTHFDKEHTTLLQIALFATFPSEGWKGSGHCP